MGKKSKYFLAIVLAVVITYAADDVKNTSGSTTDAGSKATTTSVQQTSKTGTAKAKIITPAPKTNWSKIKDLFM